MGFGEGLVDPFQGAVLLDLEFTLVDPTALAMDIFHGMAQEREVGISKQEVLETCLAYKGDELFGLPPGGVFKIYNERCDYPQGIEDGRVVLFEDTISFLESIWQRGFMTGIISDSPQDRADFLVDRFNLRRYFYSVVGYNDQRSLKPNTQIIKDAVSILTKSYRSPPSLYVIGDSHKDIECGFTYGQQMSIPVTTILVHNDKPGECQPNHQCKTLTEALEYII